MKVGAMLSLILFVLIFSYAIICLVKEDEQRQVKYSFKILHYFCEIS